MVSEIRPHRSLGEQQHVLVTGGTGFIGGQLVPVLVANGHRVTVLTRRPELPTALQALGVQGCGTLQALGPEPGIDAVVNLAGARILGFPWTEARKRTLVASRVELTDRLVAWMGSLTHKPHTLVSASAIGYYGIQVDGDDRGLTEAAPPQPLFMSTLCQSWERAAAAAVAHGVAVRCLRFGLVLGEGGALPMLLLPVRLGLGGRLGSGRQWMSWLHAQDAVGAIMHALHPRPDRLMAYNVTAPEPVRQVDFSRTAAAILRRPSVMATPGWPVRLLLGAQADLLLEGQRVVPAGLLLEGYTFAYPALEGALKQLCQPRP